MVFAIDTVDQETWSDTKGDPLADLQIRNSGWTILRMSWFHLVEIWSMIAMDGADIPESWCLGCSLGATHGANLYFRRPDLFEASCFKRSVFHGYGFGSYMDEVVYRNSPIRYLGICRRIIHLSSFTT